MHTYTYIYIEQLLPVQTRWVATQSSYMLVMPQLLCVFIWSSSVLLQQQ